METYEKVVNFFWERPWYIFPVVEFAVGSCLLILMHYGAIIQAPFSMFMLALIYTCGRYFMVRIYETVMNWKDGDQLQSAKALGLLWITCAGTLVSFSFESKAYSQCEFFECLVLTQDMIKIPYHDCLGMCLFRQVVVCACTTFLTTAVGVGMVLAYKKWKLKESF